MPHHPLIIPEIGRVEEKKIESTIEACTEIGRRIRKTSPDTVIIITPPWTGVSGCGSRIYSEGNPW